MAEQVAYVPPDEELLAACPNKGKGCFKGNPDVLEDYLRLKDPYLRARAERVLWAAIQAGKYKIPLKKATFLEATLSFVDRIPGNKESREIIIGDGQERTLADAMVDSKFRRALGAFGYRCGKTPDCPVRDLLSSRR